MAMLCFKSYYLSSVVRKYVIIWKRNIEDTDLLCFARVPAGFLITDD